MNKKLALTLILTILISSFGYLGVKAQSFDVNCQLIRTSPNGNTVYSDLMPLNFTINWSNNAKTNVIWVDMNISYSIDDNQKTIIDRVQVGPPGNSTTYKTVNVSNLTDGLHKLAISVDGIYDVDNLYIKEYHSYFEPIFFSVNILATSETPSPTPTSAPTSEPTVNTAPLTSPTLNPVPSIPELSWLAISPLFASILLAFLYRRSKV